MEHEIRFTGELLSTHKTEVVSVLLLSFLRVVIVCVVGEVSPCGLVDDGRRGDGGGYVPVQDLLVLVVVVQEL